MKKKVSLYELLPPFSDQKLILDLELFLHLFSDQKKGGAIQDLI